MKKRLLIALGLAVAFLAGYGGVAWAYPSGGVYGREEYRGYFTNTLDTHGTYVLPAFGSYGGNAFPTDLNTASEFINFIKFTKLDTDGNGSGDAQEKTGAAFIIQTMIGSSRNRPPTDAQIADWEARVRLAESQGRISWFYNYTYNINSYYQGPTGGGTTNDDAFYDDSGTSSAIVFRNESGQIIYAIRRQCANPVGNGTPLPINFNMTGRTTVSSPTVQPGQSITFHHYVRNSGPHATDVNIFWAAFDQNDNITGGAASSGTYASGQEKNVYNETVTVPSNAAAGTQYCRKVGFDPVNKVPGTRNGRGALVCATVVIPAKLKAAMSVAPPFMVGGDTATFTPSISATTNASSVTVNCSISRTLYPPSGSPSVLGPQPCVTESGDPNIVIGTGASVILRANPYIAPENIPIGARVCDVITITNPSDPSYYTSFPADQTATACVTIAKSPYVHFMGDVWAGGGFAAVAPGTCANGADIATLNRGRTISDGTMPGSGATHGVFALGRVTGFGSGGMALNTTAGTGKAWTFSNLNTSDLGYFGAPSHCINDYVDTYSSAPVIAPGAIQVSGSGNEQRRINGNASFYGPMTQGAKKVYLVYGDVTITDNLTYVGAYTSVSQLPSLVIIATGNIYVNANVTQMDGIFITRGTFYSCYPKPEPATISTCNNKLTVNGSIGATRLDLFRTAGAEAGSPAQQKEPAEVFNQSPEVFLSNALNTTTGVTITTNEVRELPPRF